MLINFIGERCSGELQKFTQICSIKSPRTLGRTKRLSRGFRLISTSRILNGSIATIATIAICSMSSWPKLYKLLSPGCWTLEAQTISRSSSQSQVGKWSPCSTCLPGVWTDLFCVARAIYNPFIYIYILYSNTFFGFVVSALASMCVYMYIYIYYMYILYNYNMYILYNYNIYWWYPK